MEKQKKKQQESVGHVIIHYFKNKNDEKARQRLVERIEQTLNQTIITHGLSQVYQEDQMTETLFQLYQELTLDFDTLKKKSTDKPEDKSRHLSSQHKLFEATRNAANKILHDKKVAYKLSSYFKCRCLTVLKHFATGEYKFYLETNQKVKSALTYLSKKGEVYKTKQGHANAYSISNSGTQPISQNIAAKTIINKDLKSCSSKHILELLQRNSEYSFTTRDISEIIAIKGLIKGQEFDIEEQAYKSYDFNAKPIARDKFIEFKSSLDLKNPKTRQELMALLAFKMQKNQYAENILTEAQLQMSETNCIESFLNDKRFSNLSPKKIKRTTAHYRYKKGRDRELNLLNHNSTILKNLLLIYLNKYLKRKFDEWAGDGNE